MATIDELALTAAKIRDMPISAALRRVSERCDDKPFLGLEWMPHKVEQELLQFDGLRPDAATRLPPSVGVKT